MLNQTIQNLLSFCQIKMNLERKLLCNAITSSPISSVVVCRTLFAVNISTICHIHLKKPETEVWKSSSSKLTYIIIVTLIINLYV
jgi:hypothetical protein